MNVKRGDVFFADLSPVVGSEQGGTRPVLVIQNDIGNRFSPTVIIAAITAQIQKAKLMAVTWHRLELFLVSEWSSLCQVSIQCSSSLERDLLRTIAIEIVQPL